MVPLGLVDELDSVTNGFGEGGVALAIAASAVLVCVVEHHPWKCQEELPTCRARIVVVERVVVEDVLARLPNQLCIYDSALLGNVCCCWCGVHDVVPWDVAEGVE